MAAETYSIPHSWRRIAAALRLALAISCSLAAVFWTEHPRGLGTELLFVFPAYALAVLLLRRLDSARMSMLRLMVDGLFFLIFITVFTDGLWLIAGFAAFLLLEAALFQEWREVAIFTVLPLVEFQALRPLHYLPLSALVLAAGAIGMILSAHRRVLADLLAEACRRAAECRAEAQGAREAERQRIAADFHDGPLQSFISFQMRLEIIRKMLEREADAGMQELRQLQDLSATQVGELRAFIRGMRAVEVDGPSLVGPIRRVVDDFRKHSGISASLLGADSLGSTDPGVSTEIVQIVREALHNAQKHSSASRVTVEVHRSGSTLEISVEDDGTGFPFGGVFTLDDMDALRIGPESIKRRIRSLEGEMTVESRPGQGAAVRMRVPV